MPVKRTFSGQTKTNWAVDLFLFISAVLASITGVYFLFLPVGGYQGERNPTFGIEILFSRSTWGDIHIWTGVLMVTVVLLHLPLHWGWVVNMTRRTIQYLLGKDQRLNVRSQFNVAINVLIGVSFFITALSGIYLLLVPGGAGWGFTDPGILFSRLTWDLIHTWAGVVLVISAVIHFAIHWGWAVKVTRKMIGVRRWRSTSHRKMLNSAA